MIAGADRFVCATAILLTSASAAASEARPTPLTVILDYTVGPGCPDAAAFRAVVIARLGYDPFVENATDHVLVRMAPRERATDGSIEWRDATGKRTGEQAFPSVSSDCPSLARAMAFALVVQIQLLARASAAPDRSAATPQESPRSPATAAEPIPKPPLAAAAISSPPAQPVTEKATTSSAAGRAPTFGIGFGPSVGFGMSSAPILLGQAFGSLVWPRASVELALAASLPATTRRADGAGFSQQHLLASVAACAIVTRWNACVLANAGEIRMAGENIDRPSSATAPLVEAGVRLRFSQNFGARTFVAAHADGVVNLVRWTGSLDQVPVWRAPRFAAALGVDAGVRFP